MKALKDLSKNELLSFISNHDIDLNKFDNLASCVACGEPDAKYYYICDRCSNTQPETQGKVKSKFIIVIHTWHVYSKGFVVVEFEGTNDEAYRESCVLKAELEGTFTSVAARVIPINKCETLAKGTRLSLKQRLLGVV